MGCDHYSGRRRPASRAMFADRLERAHRAFVSEIRMTSPSLLFVAEGDVIERQNPLKHSVTIDDRQPPHLFVANCLERRVYVFVRRGGVDFTRDDFADRYFRSETRFCRGGDGDVAIGNHADHPVLAVDHRQRAEEIFECGIVTHST